MAGGSREAHVVGAGPNGLAAAIALAEAGWRVTVHEADDAPGGGMRSAALTLPGFVHDRCSAIHPLAAASPFFARLPLARHGLVWVHPGAPCAHPLDDGTAVVCERSVAATADGLGADGAAWVALFEPLVRDWPALADDLLGPPLHVPRHPLELARFALAARRSAASLAGARFHGVRARALLAGMAAHAVLPLDALPTAAFGLVLTITAHAVGWPMPRGGAQRIADALVAHLEALGGVVRTGRRVDSLAGFPADAPVVLDLTPREVLRVAGERLPAAYRRRLARYRYGPGAFKMDWALDAPIPWRAADCARAGTVHLGGTLEEIAAAERTVADGGVPERPFVLLAQQTLFDPTRAPAGRHTAWAYCHVPNGSTLDVAPQIEAQVERFAPGFRARILARHVTAPADFERRNPNLVGGDFVGGRQSAWQLAVRPRLIRPYATPDPHLFVCSAATPPGGGVHGMCGWHAARAVGPPPS